MTAQELKEKFNREFGLHGPWPKTYIVNAETYGNVCNELIKYVRDQTEALGWEGFPRTVILVVGDNNGIMFKNVELILRGQK